MFHREGFRIITITFLIVVAIAIGSDYFIEILWVKKVIQVGALVVLLLVEFLVTTLDEEVWI